MNHLHSHETHKAIIHESELDFIARCTLDFPNTETGGDFFGFWDKNGMPVIQYVTGPGKNTRRSATSFYQDIDYLHQCGRILNSRFGLEHLGNWHSHHRLSLMQPSGGDVNTMQNCLSRPDIRTFFLTITNILPRDEVNVNGFYFAEHKQQPYYPIRWHVLEGESPVRAWAERNERSFIYPSTRFANYQINDQRYTQIENSRQKKAELPVNSFFSTQKGRTFLKAEFEKICSTPEFSQAELVQNDDETIGIVFHYEGRQMEVRYPTDFSDLNPHPMLIERNAAEKPRMHILKTKGKQFFSFSVHLLSDLKNLFFSHTGDEKEIENETLIIK